MKIITFSHAGKEGDKILDYRKLGHAIGRILKELPKDLDALRIIHSVFSYSKLTAEFIADVIGLYPDGLDQDKIYLKRWLSNPDIVFERLEKFIAEQPEGVKAIIIVVQPEELLKILVGFNKKDKFEIHRLWDGIEDSPSLPWGQGTSWLIDLEAKKIVHLCYPYS